MTTRNWVEIPQPLADVNDYAIVALDSEGNYTAINITKQAVDWAEPAALGHVLRNLIAKLEDGD